MPNQFRILQTPQTVGELKKILEDFDDDLFFGFRNQPSQDLVYAKFSDKSYLCFQEKNYKFPDDKVYEINSVLSRFCLTPVTEQDKKMCEHFIKFASAILNPIGYSIVWSRNNVPYIMPTVDVLANEIKPKEDDNLGAANSI